MTSTAPELSTSVQASDDGKSVSPHFILIERKLEKNRKPAPLIQAWNRAIELYFANEESIPFTVLEGGLFELNAKLLECDCMVSPANSFGIMDGGYDDALSQAFKGETGYWTLTDHVQAYLKSEWRGYLPPGSCAIVPLSPDLAGSNNSWNARFIAVLPTMPVPSNVAWHQDLVYNCMWSLQVAIENWNKTCIGKENMIHKVLATGLGTGCGRVGANKCARQMVLAVQHFRQPALERPRWGGRISLRKKQVAETVALKD